MHSQPTPVTHSRTVILSLEDGSEFSENLEPTPADLRKCDRLASSLELFELLQDEED